MTRFFNLCLLFLFSTTVFAGELVVLPVIADSIPGMYNSLWDSEIRIVKKDVMDSVTLRRVWVCLEDGGFVDDPLTAPSWELPWSDNQQLAPRSIVLTAADLLVGTESHIGAVAIDVDGGEVIVSVGIMDVNLGGYTPPSGVSPFGMGQAFQGQREALTGRSHIPWIGGCYGNSLYDCEMHYRNNIGIVNPNSGSMRVRLWELPFGERQLAPNEQDEAPEYVIPPYGWIQVPHPMNQGYVRIDTIFQEAGNAYFGVLNIMPEQEFPYYAYGSVVYTPPPGASEQVFGDPYFQFAQPGYYNSYRDIPYPK